MGVRVGAALIGAVAVLGALLVLTAPLDAASRSNLGVGLLTGVVVGAVLIGVEFALARQRSISEQEHADHQRRALLAYSNGRLARLTQQCAREYQHMLYGMLQGTLSGAAPRHFRGREDVRTVWRDIMWISDIDLTDPHWYQDLMTLERVDVMLLVASHMLDIEGAGPTSEEDFARLEILASDAAVRIGATADILSQLRAPDLAQRLADIASNIDLASRTLNLREAVGEAGVPQLPALSLDEDADGIVRIPRRNPGTLFLREFLAYLVDLLREGINRDRATTMTPPAESRRLVERADDEIVRSRWHSLIPTHVTTEDLWGDRFADDSWLRPALEHGANRASWSWGVDGSLPLGSDP